MSESNVPVVTLVPLTRAIGRRGKRHRQVLKAAQADGVLIDGDTPAGFLLLQAARLPYMHNRYWVPEAWALAEPAPPAPEEG